MTSITLSSATRSNLLSLQSTAEMMASTQNRLGTGKRVSSALENLVSYFTASALTSRSSDLSSIVDGMSNGIQTIQAATKGIDSIQKLIKLGQSMVDRAARSPVAVQTAASVASSASNYTTADVVGAQNAIAPRPSDTGAQFNRLNGDLFSTLVDFSALKKVDGNQITFSQPGMPSQTYTYQSAGSNPLGSRNFKNQTELMRAIGADFPSVVIADGSPFGLVSTTSDAPISASGTAVITPIQPNATPYSPADTFTYAVNSGVPVKFTYHYPANSATDAANRYFSSPASLAEAINAISRPNAPTAVVDPTGTHVVLIAADKDDYFELAGSSLDKMGYGSGPYIYDPSTSLDETQVTYTIGTGVEQKSVTINYGYASNETTTLEQLNVQLSSADMIATLDPAPTGKVVVKPIKGREADTIKLSTPSNWLAPSSTVQNGVTTLTGSISGKFSSDSVLSEPGASERRKLAKDYTALLDQISGLARDSGYNGQNLLMGDNAKIQFNEKNTSSYDVKGSRVDADGLGLEQALDGDFLDKQSLDIVAQQLRSASDFLRFKASEFATGFSLTSVRQKFTNEMINVLQTGTDNLTLADMNEEATTVTALNLRQQLVMSELSLSNQAQQGILQLLRS